MCVLMTPRPEHDTATLSDAQLGILLDAKRRELDSFARAERVARHNGDLALARQRRAIGNDLRRQCRELAHWLRARRRALADRRATDLERLKADNAALRRRLADAEAAVVEVADRQAVAS